MIIWKSYVVIFWLAVLPATHTQMDRPFSECHCPIRLPRSFLVFSARLKLAQRQSFKFLFFQFFLFPKTLSAFSTGSYCHMLACLLYCICNCSSLGLSETWIMSPIKLQTHEPSKNHKDSCLKLSTLLAYRLACSTSTSGQHTVMLAQQWGEQQPTHLELTHSVCEIFRDFLI